MCEGKECTCGCCEGVVAETPAVIYNRAGLSAIAYRVGTHSKFKNTMLAGLSRADRPALAGLNTRDDDDFSIALLDAWATLADVLTFYQERLADEQYLRTATERLSVLELARLIGYKLNPGKAASTWLAFEMETAPGSPTEAVIDIGTRVQSLPGPGEVPQSFETIERIVARPEFNLLRAQTRQIVLPVFGDRSVYLAGITTGLKPGDALLFIGDEQAANPDAERWDFRRVASVTPDPTRNLTFVTWEEGLGTALPGGGRVYPAASGLKIYAMQQRASLFGYNAPDVRNLAGDVRSQYKIGEDDKDWTALTIFNIDSSDFVPDPVGDKKTIYLDQVYSGIKPDDWIVLSIPEYQEVYRVTGATETNCRGFTLSAKVTRLNLQSNENLNAEFNNRLRATTVFLPTAELQLASRPLTTLVEGFTVTLDQPVKLLVPGQTLIFSGIDAGSGEKVSEAVQIKAINSNFTGLTLTSSLVYRYQRDSLEIRANVAAATHGETQHEILGSGNGSQPFQKFVLKQSPLTYTSASNSSGTASTLEVWVNDVLWHEVPTFYGQGPRDRVYTTQNNDDGTTTIEFGDGETGARLPTGFENVRAIYRKGTGLGGMVKAGQLSLLMTRILGVRSATNPVGPEGAADPEKLEEARTNSPLTVLTLDRIVSLSDYQDFARAFGGIAKALASWTWDGQTRGIFLTVAGPNGAPLADNSTTLKDLRTVMQKYSDPFVPITIKSYDATKALFKIAARIRIDPDFDNAGVLAAVAVALAINFSFETRQFGQPVTVSQVVAVIQAVPGVVAVVLDKLYRKGQAAILNQNLVALLPIAGAKTVEPAQLLMLELVAKDDLGVLV